jgi:hypothetical protein
MATYIHINDSGGNTWPIGMSDSSILSSVSVSQQSPAAIYLNDYATNTTTWLLTIITSGIIGTQQTLSYTWAANTWYGVPFVYTWGSGQYFYAGAIELDVLYGATLAP